LKQAVDLYTRQCSIGVTRKTDRDDGRHAAAIGKTPSPQAGDGRFEVPPWLAVMATAGL
jgi:hypothetical protein